MVLLTLSLVDFLSLWQAPEEVPKIQRHTETYTIVSAPTHLNLQREDTHLALTDLFFFFFNVYKLSPDYKLNLCLFQKIQRVSNSTELKIKVTTTVARDVSNFVKFITVYMKLRCSDTHNYIVQPLAFKGERTNA